tara:strand:+ start:2786 stop:3097 length:312 start_codon:yes stop_codon:yes gene_type:complete
MKTKTKHKINHIAPRLSDEDVDPIEQDDLESPSLLTTEGWLLWSQEDINDIQRLIQDKMPVKQQFIIDAFLDGQNYHDIGVTEKYWRYHFTKGIEFIKKELKL